LNWLEQFQLPVFLPTAYDFQNFPTSKFLTSKLPTFPTFPILNPFLFSKNKALEKKKTAYLSEPSASENLGYQRR